LTTPAFVTADLVRPYDATLADLLAGIAYASSAIVTLGYARSQVAHALDGFGFVVPAIEGRRIIAGSFTNVKYEGRVPAGQVLLRVFAGGVLAAHLATLPDAELVAVAEQELAELLDVRGTPALVRVARHLRAMPQYEVGHLARIAAIEAATTRLGGLAVAGSAYRGVGIPDCVHSGERAIDAFFDGVLQP
jgi:oxygen-dependent protoporphyrinogen oxidase